MLVDKIIGDCSPINPLGDTEHVVGAKFIAPASVSETVPRIRIGRRDGRNEFGPYNIAALSEQFVNEHNRVSTSF